VKVDENGISNATEIKIAMRDEKRVGLHKKDRVGLLSSTLLQLCQLRVH